MQLGGAGALNPTQQPIAAVDFGGLPLLDLLETINKGSSDASGGQITAVQAAGLVNLLNGNPEAAASLLSPGEAVQLLKLLRDSPISAKTSSVTTSAPPPAAPHAASSRFRAASPVAARPVTRKQQLKKPAAQVVPRKKLQPAATRKQPKPASRLNRFFDDELENQGEPGRVSEKKNLNPPGGSAKVKSTHAHKPSGQPFIFGKKAMAPLSQFLKLMDFLKTSPSPSQPSRQDRHHFPAFEPTKLSLNNKPKSAVINQPRVAVNNQSPRLVVNQRIFDEVDDEPERAPGLSAKEAERAHAQALQKHLDVVERVNSLHRQNEDVVRVLQQQQQTSPEIQLSNHGQRDENAQQSISPRFQHFDKQRQQSQQQQSQQQQPQQQLQPQLQRLHVSQQYQQLQQQFNQLLQQFRNLEEQQPQQQSYDEALQHHQAGVDKLLQVQQQQHYPELSRIAQLIDWNRLN